MADTAAWLVDDVIPDVPVRQWVLSVPFEVRFALARDAKLLTKALGVFLREVFAGLRRRTGGEPGDVGAVTGIQRFGGSLNLNVHFHAVVIDGVYREGRFRPAPRPKRSDLEAMVVRVRRKIDGLLRREGVRLHDEEESVMEPLDLFQAASIRRRVATSVDARAVEVVGGERASPPNPRKQGLEAGEQGYSIHAAVRMKAADRKGREILLRYVLRPSFAEERMIRLPDGRVAYRFRRAWDDGSSHVILTPMEMMAKLAALVPPPRYHLVRYHGVLAPNSKRRRAIVKAAPPECGHGSPATIQGTAGDAAVPVEQTPLPMAGVPRREPESPPMPGGVAGPSQPLPSPASPADVPAEEGPAREPVLTPQPVVFVAPRASCPSTFPCGLVPPTVLPGAGPAAPGSPSPVPAEREPRGSTPPAHVRAAPVRPVARPVHARRSWAALMLRSLMLDVLKCPRCPGRMKVIACLDQPEVIEKFLRSAGLWTEPPTRETSGIPALPPSDDSPCTSPSDLDDRLDDPPLD
jgi:hypothetical protein